MLKPIVELIVCLGVVQVLISSVRSQEIKYNNFDEYLRNTNNGIRNKISNDDQEEDLEGSGDLTENLSINPRFRFPIRTGLATSKDVVCCSLGYHAGDKGYHCISKFYSGRIMQRNQNRAQNRKMGFHGENSDPSYGTSIMRTFEQCVALKNKVFQKCCDMAAKKKHTKPHFNSLQRQKWQEKKFKMVRLPKQWQVEDDLVDV